MERGLGTLGFVRSFYGRGIPLPLVLVRILPFDPPGQKGGNYDKERQKRIHG